MNAAIGAWGVSGQVAQLARFAALLFASLLCPLVSLQTAEAAPRRTAIALVSGGANAELSARLRAELAGLGWRVVELEPWPSSALAQLARRANTLAVLRVGPRAEGIEVWATPEVGAEASSEWVEVEAARSEIAVLRAVEVLRAHFVKLGIEPEGMHSAVALPRLAKPARAKPEVPIWLGARIGLAASPGGVPPLAYVGALVRWVPAPFAALTFEVWAPPGSATVRGTEGGSRVRPFLSTALFEPQFRLRRWLLSAGLGAALALLDTRGEPARGYTGQRDGLVTALALARSGARWELTRHCQLGGQLTLGVAAPRAVIRFDERIAASWGRPWLLGAVGVEWAAFSD